MPLISFSNIAEALTAFPLPPQFRLALVDDVHFGEGRFEKLSAKDLMEACGIEIGSFDQFCISQVPSDRAAMNRGDDYGWTFLYTYRIQGRNRRIIRFQSEHGNGGVCEKCVGPYIYRSPMRGIQGLHHAASKK